MRPAENGVSKPGSPKGRPQSPVPSPAPSPAPSPGSAGSPGAHPQPAKHHGDTDELPEATPRVVLFQKLAHELRGPAGVASQALRELESALADGRPVAPLSAMIRRSVQRFTRLAERLSLAGELERGTLRLERVPVDIRETVRAASAEAAALLARRAISLKVEEPEEKVAVEADARWLGVAITEVCNNALRFARKEVLVRVMATTGTVSVVVEDDGPGFGDVSPLDEQKSSQQSSGLGLSLPIVRDVLAAHDGTLRFGRSSLGGGAVTMALPALGAT
jgi:two-component system, OmpR family, phosphate regulon sensor histidine kinase PhoR